MGVRVQRNQAKVPKKKGISPMGKPKVALMMKKSAAPKMMKNSSYKMKKKK
tara:strand:+ start:264 stop:416 length:153 start_codon:yes stop_codon:yes gene_type:complete